MGVANVDANFALAYFLIALLPVASKPSSAASFAILDPNLRDSFPAPAPKVAPPVSAPKATLGKIAPPTKAKPPVTSLAQKLAVPIL